MRRQALIIAWGVLGAYAIGHAVIDASCAALLWGCVHDHLLSSTTAWPLFILYNLVAFAVQPLVGLMADRLRGVNWVAVTGCALTAAGLALGTRRADLFVFILAAGVGNTLFHVGGGTISLRFSPGRALPAGVFVAPGAGGLVFGMLAGKAGDSLWPFTCACLALVFAYALLPTPALSRDGVGRSSASGLTGRAAETVVLLLLLVIGLRSYVGLALVFPWKSHAWLLWALTAAIVSGKALGGALADRFGWQPVAVGAVIVSAPLLATGSGVAAAGVAGAFIFNLTMPVTLAAVARAMPGHEGFAFGVTCLALFVGAMPVLWGWSWAAAPPAWALFATAAAGAIALSRGLTPFSSRFSAGLARQQARGTTAGDMP